MWSHRGTCAPLDVSQVSGSGVPWIRETRNGAVAMIINRRSALRAVSLSALVTTPVLSGCASATTAEPAISVISAAASSWFFDLTRQVAATLIVDAAEKAFISGWENWQKPTDEAIRDQADKGYPWHTLDIYGHWLPATSIVQISRVRELDPANDRLVSVPGNGDYIALDSWAWRAVDAFIKQETKGKTDDDLLHIRQLLAKTVLPCTRGASGTSPRLTTSWVTYSARDGDVEIVYSWSPEGAQVVMTSTGFFSGSPGNPTVKSFKLTDTA
jgi:hypothetical protein